jgi:hypothetical protein
MIDWVSEYLIAYRIRATWFVTHSSPAIDRLRRYPDLFELGIHPNFLPGSTHGDTLDAVLSHCLGLVPDAVSMRTHASAWSSHILKCVLMQTSITTDVSIFAPYTPCLRPIQYRYLGRELIRIPYFWEDDVEMENPAPNWHLTPFLEMGDGLKIFNFHPIHVYLNSSDLEPYQALKRYRPDLAQMTSGEAQNYVHIGEGALILFIELIEHLKIHQSICIRDIYQRWQMENEAN